MSHTVLPLTENLEDALAVARMLLRGDEAQVQNGVRQLEELVRRYPGTHVAQEAMDELRRYDAERTSEPSAQELRFRRFRTKLATIHSLDDGRLPAFLANWRTDLDSDEDYYQLVALKLKTCLEQELAQDTTLAELDQLHERLGRAVQSLPRLADTLTEPRRRLERLRFQARSAVVRDKVVGALRSWQTGEGWKLYESLEAVTPEEHRPELEDLQVHIARVEQSRENAQNALDEARVLAMIEDRASFLKGREISDRLRASLNENPPPIWKGLLEEQVRRLKDAARLFLQADGERVMDLTGLIAFLDLLNKPVEEDGVPELLESTVGRVEENLRGKVREAKDVQELEIIRDQVREAMRRRLDLLEPHLLAIENGLQCVITVWQGPWAGDELVIPEGFPVPETVEERIRGRRQARARLRQQLDETLASWRIDEFVQLCRSASAPQRYCQLVEKADWLRGLAGLAAEPEFAEVEQGCAWLSRWDSAAEQLGPDMPTALAEAVTGERTRRQHRLEGLKRTEHLKAIATAIERRQWEEAEQLMAQRIVAETELERFRVEVLFAQAELAGGGELIRLLCERWRELQYYFPDRAGMTVEAAVERACRENNAAGLERLAVVVRRARNDRVLEADRLHRISELVDWATLEQLVRTEASEANIRQLWSHVQGRQGSALVNTGLRRLVSHWDEADLVASVWADRALASWKPPVVVSAQDPLVRLTHAWEQAAAEADGKMDTNRVWTSEETDTLQARFAGCDVQIDRLNRLLEIARQPAVPLPKSYVQARGRADLLARTLRQIVELEVADLRRPDWRDRWGGVRFRIQTELTTLAAAPALLQRADRLSRLTKLGGLEQAMMEKARACRDFDRDSVFPELYEQVLEIVQRFEECGAIGSSMWKIVSSEYWPKVLKECGDLQDLKDPGDLRALVGRVEELARDEEAFRTSIERLRDAQPPTPEGGTFDPARHRDYVALFPVAPPKSERVRALFLRFLKQEPRPTIVRQSTGVLPGWISWLCFGRGEP